MLGIWGEPSVTGKAVGNDLRQHKKTLADRPRPRPGRRAARAALHGLLEGELTEAEVQEATRLLEQCGAREETMAIGETQLCAALGSLERVPLRSSGRARSWPRSPAT